MLCLYRSSLNKRLIETKNGGSRPPRDYTKVLLSISYLWQFECRFYRGIRFFMKIKLVPFNSGLTTFVVGALMLVTPAITFAQRGGHSSGGGGGRASGSGGGHFSSGGGGRGFSGGGGQHFAGPSGAGSRG